MAGYMTRAAVVCLGVLALPACNALFSLTEVKPVDAGVPVDAPDASPDGPDEWGFSIGVPVAELNSTAVEGDPTLTEDMLEIYFRSTRSGGMGLDDLWYSTRASTSDLWGPPQLSKLSTAEYENQPRLSPDGLTMWFRRGGGATARLMVVTRGTAKDDAGWSVPAALNEFDATDPNQDAALMSTVDPAVTGYMISKRSNNQLRIFSTTRASPSMAWSTPTTPIPDLVGDGTYDQSPWMTPGQQTIIFASDRSGGRGGSDLWIARRQPNGSFSVPVCLTEVNDSGVQADPWMSGDLRHIYYTGLNYNIFEASR